MLYLLPITPQQTSLHCLPFVMNPVQKNDPPYPHGLDVHSIAPVEIAKFTSRCKELGLKYMGICCGNTGKLTLVMAETLGRKTELSCYHDHSNKGTDV